MLNYLYEKIQSRPIDVDEITNKIDQLRNITEIIFEEVDEKTRLANLAEHEVVLLNAYRNEQDVAQALDQLELEFMNSEFENVYSQASSLLKSKQMTNGQ